MLDDADNEWLAVRLARHCRVIKGCMDGGGLFSDTCVSTASASWPSLNYGR